MQLLCNFRRVGVWQMDLAFSGVTTLCSRPDGDAVTMIGLLNIIMSRVTKDHYQSGGNVLSSIIALKVETMGTDLLRLRFCDSRSLV